MGQEFVVPSFNTNRYYNKNTENIAVLPTGLTAGMVIYVQSDGTLDGSLNFSWDNTNNRLGIGTTTPEAPLEIVTVGTTGLSYLATNYSTNGAGPYLRLRQSRGTEAAPTIVSNGDDLGYLQFQGYDGAAFRVAANITASVDGTPGSSDMPGRLIFSTTPDGSATLTERLRIDSLGRIQQQVGGATAQALAGSTFVVAKSQSGITTVGSGRYFSLQNTGGSANEVVEIGFGYIGAGVNQPVLIGHKVSDATASTKGSLYMAVRDVTTDTAPTEVWTLGSTGQVTQNMPAAASTAETLHTWTVSDDATSKIFIDNATAVDGNFLPRLNFVQSGTSANFLTFQGTTDTGAAAVGIINVKIGAATAVTTRPMLQIQNNSTGKWVMSANGAIAQVITSAASTAETLHTWSVSDDATAKLTVQSGTTNDSAFIPQIRGFGSSTRTGLQLISQLVTDTGTDTAMLFDARVGTSTNVATRPAFQFSNNATIIAGFTGSTDGGRLIIGGDTLTPYGASGGLLEINKSAATSNISLNSWAGASAGIGNILYFNKSRSSTVGTQTIVASGDFIGGIFWRGSDGASFQHVASIEAQVGGTPGTGDMPGRMVFYTSPDGAVTQTERMRISSRGNILVNLGAIAEPSTSVGTLVLTNTATAPTTSVDAVSLYAADISAGNASLAMTTETAVVTESITSDRTLRVTINGTSYRILLAV